MNNLYPLQLKELPIYENLDLICTLLKESKTKSLVLTAETAAGKSTALPLAILNHFAGKAVMLEPRRIAVLNIASRVSELLGENMGQTVGYKIHLESKVSKETRFTVLTEAILVRMLQADPLLEDINVVVIDEFHERSVHADLALAFLKETMQLRDDLYVIVMSATMDTDKIARFLGTDDESAPIYNVKGRNFKVEVEYNNSSSLETVIKSELYNKKNTGDILVFLPGIKEIRQTKQNLIDMGTDKDADILILHSSVPIIEQKNILKEKIKGTVIGTDKKKRIILSSSIAETSLTVPNITLVIDSGYSRVNVYNPRVGMQKLVTQRETVFNAEQRKGRAGRVSNGRCIRLWNEKESLLQELKPGILRSDLANLVLECYAWGAKEINSLNWLDQPLESSWQSAVALLELLGCMKEGLITELGKASLSLGLNVREACVALSGILFNKLELSTSIALEYAEQNIVDKKSQENQRIELKKRCQIFQKNSQIIKCFPQEFTNFSTEFALLCGFSDRIGIKVDESSSNVYKFPSGREAKLFSEFLPKYIIAIDVDAGDRIGTIYKSVPVEELLVVNFMEQRSKIVMVTEFLEDKTCKKFKKLCYGKIILREEKIKIEKSDYLEAVSQEVNKNGVEWLPLSNESKNLLLRCQFYLQNCSKGDSYGNTLGDKYQNLKDTVLQWLSPFVIDSNKLTEKNVFDALCYWLEELRLQNSVPIKVQLANGKTKYLDYVIHDEKVCIELELIIQQAFGIFETPKIMGKPILFKLLSPARRPLQITNDLENFWANTWPEICKEMKGRYPKHNWDYRVVQKD